MKAKKFISVENVSKSFSKRLVLDDVSLDVGKGEIFGLIGINGIGKTTLIKIILDLLFADSGKADIFGISSKNVEARKNIAYLPEKFSPSMSLKGREFLSFSLGYFNKIFDKKKAEYYANKLDLDTKFFDAKVTGYSKGMGQKLGLISMFLSEAPLLLLDEPMSGLDPHVRIRLKDLLKDYANKGNSVFFSSHILSDIDEICDKIGVIHKGKLVFVGTSKDFKTKYKADSLERAFLKVIEK
jgi:ABC-2 type transport system ATP-binding protein